jgi:hypothetical protein
MKAGMRLLLIALLLPLSVWAQELRVLSGGAAKSLVDPLAASFRNAVVKLDYQPMGRLVELLDFIDHLTGPEARQRLAQAGYTAPE